jgi:Ca-activated chloride channel family protein
VTPLPGLSPDDKRPITAPIRLDNTLTFAQPAWLWFLLSLVPLVLLRWRSVRLRSEALRVLVAPRLKHRLVTGQSSGRRQWVRYCLQVFAFACLIVTLARPQYGVIREESTAEGRNIIIALDTSRSMLANDLEPSRLIRAKLAAQDLIEALPTDRIGLIAFSGSCFLQAPLTIDHEAVIESIQQLDTEVIPRGGTNVSRALELAAETFAKEETTNNAVILFSDGEDLEGSTGRDGALEKAADAKMTIVTVGVGTRSGSIIPDPESEGGAGFIRDREGNIVRSRLDDTLLKGLAHASGGLYLSLHSANTTRDIVGRAINRIERTEIESTAIEIRIDRYRWPLGLGILCFVISIVPWPRKEPSPRKASVPLSASTVSLMVLLCLPGTAGALGEADLNAIEDFKSGAYEEALAKYDEAIRKAWLPGTRSRLQFGRGAAAYKLGEFEQAARSFGDALRSGSRHIQESSHYNLGNTLYREGEAQLEDPANALRQWEDAVSHYESALALNRANDEARHNLDLVKKRIEELKQQQEQEQEQEQQEQDQNQDSEDQNQEGDQEGDQEKNDDGSENQQQEPSDESPEGDGENQEGTGETPEQAPQEPQDQDGGGDEEQQEEQAQQVPEGDIDAQEDEQRRQEQADARASDQPHPETGYTPSEARDILRRYSGEDLDVKPLVPRNYEPILKNW